MPIDLKNYKDKAGICRFCTQGDCLLKFSVEVVSSPTVRGSFDLFINDVLLMNVNAVPNLPFPDPVGTPGDCDIPPLYYDPAYPQEVYAEKTFAETELNCADCKFILKIDNSEPFTVVYPSDCNPLPEYIYSYGDISEYALIIRDADDVLVYFIPLTITTVPPYEYRFEADVLTKVKEMEINAAGSCLKDPDD